MLWQRERWLLNTGSELLCNSSSQQGKTHLCSVGAVAVSIQCMQA